MLIRKAEMFDVDFWVLGKLTDDDINEFNALDPNRYIRTSLCQSLGPDTVVLTGSRGEVLAIGGNVDDCVWFLTTNETKSLGPQGKRLFRKTIMEYRDQMLDLYGTIYNHVWVGNKSHHKFLKSIGAVFHEEFLQSPVTGELFQLFTISDQESAGGLENL